MTGILDFPNQDKLSEFLKLYLTSFFLGMLARYYRPSGWDYYATVQAILRDRCC